MPDTRAHRGLHPQDLELFAEKELPALREAARDLSWLQGRGYTDHAALKLVGDRYALTARQRMAVMRSACPDGMLASRRARRLEPAQVAGRPLWIDGFNVVATLEVALSGGLLLRGRDGCLRDLASIHGSYRKVTETLPSLGLLADCVAGLQAAAAVIYLDSPVSNSGRLAAVMREVAAARGELWTVELVPSPDRVLREAGPHVVVATSDGGILDRCGPWLPLSALVVGGLDDVRLVDLG